MILLIGATIETMLLGQARGKLRDAKAWLGSVRLGIQGQATEMNKKVLCTCSLVNTCAWIRHLSQLPEFAWGLDAHSRHHRF